MPPRRKNLINGEWVSANTGETFDVRNPADNDEIVGEYPRSSSDDMNAAIESATEALDTWASTPGPDRGDILREAATILEQDEDDLIETLVLEEGKTATEAGEVRRSIDIFYYYAEKARDIGGTRRQSSAQDQGLYTIREPLGVSGLITPWNYPSAIPAWKLGPALAAGNTVVLKPASAAPGPACQLVEALDEAGIPPGVVNLVTGPAGRVGETLISHPDVDAISFTGSSTVGNHVYETASTDQKRVQCEMGGKNPTIVMPSADMDEAIDVVGAGAFGVTGQACTACSRAIVHSEAHEEFLAGIVDYAQSLSIGPGSEDPDMGPQVNSDELEDTLEYIAVGKEEGASLETGGDPINDGGKSNGHFVEPTVFAEVDPTMRIAQEEIFGPVLSVIEVGGFEEAIAVANNVPFGLSASICTADLEEAHEFIDRIEAGVAKVNAKTTGLELHVPFGGYKQSSTNTYREQGDAGLEFFSNTKTVYLSH